MLQTEWLQLYTKQNLQTINNRKAIDVQQHFTSKVL